MFTLGIPKGLAGVQARFADAVARKQEWINAYLATLKLKPGEPLPYHPEMEVSRAEYEALLDAYAHPTIMPQGTIRIEVECARGVFRLRAPAPYDFLNQVEIDSRGKLHGPFQLECVAEAAKSRSAKFGTWSGTTWLFESADPARGSARHFELSIGSLEKSGRRFLYFDHFLGMNGQRLAADQLLAWVTRADAAAAP